MLLFRLSVIVLATVALAVAGCGSSKKSSSSASSAGARSAEAASAATGDIPDNQVFLTFRNSAAGYSIKYPEGWTQQGSGTDVAFRDKNNIVRIVVSSGGPFAAADVHVQGGTVSTGPTSTTIS